MHLFAPPTPSAGVTEQHVSSTPSEGVKSPQSLHTRCAAAMHLLPILLLPQESPNSAFPHSFRRSEIAADHPHALCIRHASFCPSNSFRRSHRIARFPIPSAGVKSPQSLHTRCAAAMHLFAHPTPSAGVTEQRVFPTPSEGVRSKYVENKGNSFCAFCRKPFETPYCGPAES